MSVWLPRGVRIPSSGQQPHSRLHGRPRNQGRPIVMRRARIVEVGSRVLKFLAGARIAAGFRHTCAVNTRGQLVCFGWNEYGQCNVPPNLSPVVAVAAGYGHTCALTVDGQLVAFGYNLKGQCRVPENLGPVESIAAGGCLLRFQQPWSVRCAIGSGPSCCCCSRVLLHVRHASQRAPRLLRRYCFRASRSWSSGFSGSRYGTHIYVHLYLYSILFYSILLYYSIV